MESIKQTFGLDSPRLGYIGLGNMGIRIAKNIAEKGTFSGPLTVYNRTTSKAEELAATVAAGKVQVSTTIVEVVEQSDIIFTCLSNDQAMTATIHDALKASSIKGKLFVDNSTIHPDTTNQLAKTINAAGADFVAEPVFGAPAAAEAAQLVCVIAGPKAAVDRMRSYAKGVIGRAEIDFIDQPQGNATRLKVIGNTFVLGLVEILAEGHVLAEKSGVGSDYLHKLVQLMFPGPIASYSTRMVEGAYFRKPPGWSVDLARKDAHHAMDIADIVGVNLAVTKIADEHLQVVKEHQGPSGDIASIYGAVRQESGLKYEL